MILIKDLAKKFNSEFVVTDINLSISPGEIVGLLGPNGAGKTTTLRMLSGVLPPTRGEILIKGENINGLNSRKVKKMIGFLPENNPLYEEMTVEEYLKFFSEVKDIDRDEKRNAIDFVVENCGIQPVYYRPISELSKGFRQRVGLAQAILTQPEILILDEPTEGLDPNQRQEIARLIINLGKRKTVIISSHILAEIAKICNRLIIIHKGKVVADGSTDELKMLGGKNRIIELEAIGSKIVDKLKKIDGVINVEEKKKNYFIITTFAKKDLRKDIYQTAVSQKWVILTMLQRGRELEEIFRQLTSE